MILQPEILGDLPLSGIIVLVHIFLSGIIFVVISSKKLSKWALRVFLLFSTQVLVILWFWTCILAWTGSFSTILLFLLLGAYYYCIKWFDLKDIWRVFIACAFIGYTIVSLLITFENKLSMPSASALVLQYLPHKNIEMGLLDAIYYYGPKYTPINLIEHGFLRKYYLTKFPDLLEACPEFLKAIKTPDTAVFLKGDSRTSIFGTEYFSATKCEVHSAKSADQ